MQLVDVREEQELEIASLPGFKHYPLRCRGPSAVTNAQQHPLDALV